MQPLFDMINSLQITALLPLTNIKLTAEMYTFFDIVMIVVAFDFFPLYDPGFTETEAYNVKFSWFGFDSINFVQDLGTFLTCVITLMIVQTLITLVIYYCITNKVEAFLVH